MSLHTSKAVIFINRIVIFSVINNFGSGYFDWACLSCYGLASIWEFGVYLRDNATVHGKSTYDFTTMLVCPSQYGNIG